jgi:hypothetical protein
MSLTSSYLFDNLGRIGADSTDNTERTVSNTKFANYMLSNYSSDSVSTSHVDFALQQPAINFNGLTHGTGLNGGVVDVDSRLLINAENERPLEKLQLMERPFLTVPYLGRGSCDPSLESQLQQGEIINEKKSVSTLSENSNLGYVMYVSDHEMVERVRNPSNVVEEAALNGWVRGGASSREMPYNYQGGKK